MEIRKATIADIPAISRIHALTWKAAYQGLVPQQYLDELKEESWIGIFTDSISKHLFTVQLICDGETPVGCISYGKSRDDGPHDWGEIVSLYLLPQYWGKGYAKQNHFSLNKEETEFEFQGEKLSAVKYVYSFKNLSLKV